MSVMDKIRVANFFSGAGGLDLRFKGQGFDIIYAPRKYSYSFAQCPH
jgi:hypothetical protein